MPMFSGVVRPVRAVRAKTRFHLHGTGTVIYRHTIIDNIFYFSYDKVGKSENQQINPNF
jgi:hypothetical protein